MSKTETKSTVLLKHDLKQLRLPTMHAECLDHFLVFGKRHLDYLIGSSARLDLSQIKCQTRLGGLLKHYYREAA